MNTFKKDGSADSAYNLLLHTKVSESASITNSDVLFLIKRGMFLWRTADASGFRLVFQRGLLLKCQCDTTLILYAGSFRAYFD